MKIDVSGDEIKIYDFDAQECFRIARKLEEESIGFYKGLLEKLPQAKNGIKDVIGKMLQEEELHLAFFRDLLEKYHDSDDSDMLEEMVDSKVISPLSRANLEEVLCNREEAIKLGLAVEKRSVEFYEKLLENTEDRAGREALQKIISEEIRHSERLFALA